jgi:hypothetical protein
MKVYEKSPEFRKQEMRISKLSPEARILLASERGGSVRILVALHGELNASRESQLEILGCRLRGSAGEVIKAEMPARLLEALTDLDFIRYIEISRPLAPE